MKKGPVIAAGALILLPTIFALWMGWRALESDRAGARANIERAFLARLTDLKTDIDAFLKKTESDFLDATEGMEPAPDALRSYSRGQSLVRQAFYISDGRLVFPPRSGGSMEENDFHQRAQALLAEGELDRETGGEYARIRPSSGWRSWFHAEGQIFAFWRRANDGGILGLELNSAAMMSRLAGILPEALPGPLSVSAISNRPGAAAGRLFVLVDARGHDFMAWGDYQRKGEDKPLASLSLDSPLNGWQLQSYASSGELSLISRAESWLLILGGIVLALIITGALIALSRGIGQEMNEARQRVSFVNQVSHELKTPLTNIRLYVDLLRANPDPSRSQNYLEVISTESERLTRLIHNVLSFARKEKRDPPRSRDVDWNETVAESLACFKPAFREKGLELEFRPGASTTARIDPDWAAQILGNLVSNAEKYAAEGKLINVECGVEAGMAWARVRDRGPGIPPSEKERIFQPFTRLSDSIREGVSGSGLGLSISQELARAHGGDLILEECSGKGASFLLRLREV